MKTMQMGFARTNLLSIIAVGFIVLAGYFVCAANIYYTEEDVLKDLSNGCSGLKKILKSERNFFAKSVITVETYYGVHVVYELDTNFRYQYSYNFKTR